MTPNRAKFRLTAPTVREFRHAGMTFRVVKSEFGMKVTFCKNGRWMAANVDAEILAKAAEALTIK